ncbi:MAG: adenosylcobalamin-dependent ribonucleoside-diphosphate reductase [Candidatus Hermodarchaeia archaeon]
MSGEKNRRYTFAILEQDWARRRYLWKDKHGKVTESPDQMLHRVANTIMAEEAKYGATDSQVKARAGELYELMSNGVFLPNSPTMMNAGRKNGVLSACFVLDVNDSIEEIFDTEKNTALIQQAGGGTGYCFDKLRPTGDNVTSTGGTTSGPISFMKVYSESTSVIQQAAFRRGANMGMLGILHPDILNFIYAKRKTGVFVNFNLSVKVTDEFMDKLQNNPQSPHVVTNCRTEKKYIIPQSVGTKPYTINDLVPIDKKAETHCYTTKDIWETIVRCAHATGEPGICFIDRINEDNPTPRLGRIEATNPCGEQPLLPNEACNLGSINVAEFVTEDGTDLDWDLLAKTVKLAVRFLDDVIDASHYPIKEIRKITTGNRKIGLGIMGFADMLVRMLVKYNSKEAVKLAGKLAAFIQKHAHQASKKLAKERGCFPNWKGSVWDTQYNQPMRNAAVTTIAPTGSISRIAGCSSGIEPIFQIAKSNIQNGQKLIQLHPLIEELGTRERWLSDKVRHLLGQGVSPKDIPEIPSRISQVIVTAHQVVPEWHVRIQAAFQEFTDNAVSKTINLPLDTTVDDVDKAFRLTYELGCKGTTVYRDASRIDEEQVLTASEKATQRPRQRAHKTKGQTTKFRMGCGTLFVTVNKDSHGLCEVFANLGKAGGCPSQSEAMCRAVSAALRCGVDPKVLTEQLKGIRCLSTIANGKTNKNIDVLSCPDAIARAIEDVLEEDCESAVISIANRCPDCGQPLRKELGCSFCDKDNCGYTKCG